MRAYGFSIKAIVIISKEATVEIYASRDGGEAARELGAAGGEAEKTVCVGEVLMALG